MERMFYRLISCCEHIIGVSEISEMGEGKESLLDGGIPIVWEEGSAVVYYHIAGFACIGGVLSGNGCAGLVVVWIVSTDATR